MKTATVVPSLSPSLYLGMYFNNTCSSVHYCDFYITKLQPPDPPLKGIKGKGAWGAVLLFLMFAFVFRKRCCKGTTELQLLQRGFQRMLTINTTAATTNDVIAAVVIRYRYYYQ